MFGFSEPSKISGYITCGNCGKRIEYCNYTPTQIYCPNCWKVIDVPPVNKFYQHEYDKETGKLTKFNSELLDMIAKQEVEQEKQSIDKKEEIQKDSIILYYTLAKKISYNKPYFSGQELKDIEIYDKIVQEYLTYKMKYRKEFNLQVPEEEYKLLQALNSNLNIK